MINIAKYQDHYLMFNMADEVVIKDNIIHVLKKLDRDSIKSLQKDNNDVNLDDSFKFEDFEESEETYIEFVSTDWHLGRYFKTVSTHLNGFWLDDDWGENTQSLAKQDFIDMFNEATIIEH